MTSAKPFSPWWQATPDIKRFPTLDGDIRADVAVIGAGIVGTMAAWECAQKGLEVVLVEQHHVCTGDTGFSTAFILHAPDAPFEKIRRQLGEGSFAELITVTRSTRDKLRSLVASQHIDCSWADQPALFGSYVRNDPTLHTQWDALAGLDPDARWVSDSDARPFVEAIRFDHEASMNPRAFVVDLLSRKNLHLRVFEDTKVTRLVPGSPVTIITPTGKITADKVIVAAGSPDALLPDVAKLLTPTTSFVLTAVYPGSPPVPDYLFWDTDSPYQYYRRLDSHTVMLGGADKPAGVKVPNQDDPYSVLQGFLDRRFPGYVRIDCRWSGTLFETSDSLPIIGQHPIYPTIFVAAGFSGNGLSMGPLAGSWLAAAVTGHPASLAPIFSPGRYALLRVPSSRAFLRSPVGSTSRRFSVALFAWLAAAVAIAVPTIAFFSGNALGLGHTQTLTEFSRRLFPLFGLYAFTLVWAQIILGSFAPFWRKYFPRVNTLHRRLGVFALVFALLHPSLLFVGVGPTVYFARTYVAPNLVPLILVGYVQLFLLVTTACTALLMKLPWLKTRWRIIHWFNYAVFFLVFFHSWFLGHNLRSSESLRILWIVYGVTVLCALGLRVQRARRKVNTMQTDSGSSVDLGPIENFPNHQGVPIQVGQTTIALFRSDEKCWAIANTCSHAGGPLCEGAFDGTSVVCPWHGSRFDLTSGAVLRGPATQPQRVWPVTVSNGRIILKQ